MKVLKKFIESIKRYQYSIALGCVVLISVAVFQNVTKLPTTSVPVQLKVTTTQLCGLTFDKFTAATGTAGYQVFSGTSKVKGLSLPVIYPSFVRVHQSMITGNNKFSAALNDTTPVTLKNPLLPAVHFQNKTEPANTIYCAKVKKYYEEWTSLTGSINLGSNWEVSIKGGNSAQITQSNSLSVKVPQTARVAPATPNTPTGLVNYVIIVQDEYLAEANTLAQYRQSQGNVPAVIAVSQLPGYDPTAATPPDCEGSYLNECYHYYGTPFDTGATLTADVVPGLIGMVGKSAAGQNWNRLTFVPGIIRAEIRHFKNLNPNLRGVLLIGDPEVIPASAYAAGIDIMDSGLLIPGTDLYYTDPYTSLASSGSDVSVGEEDTSGWMPPCYSTAAPYSVSKPGPTATYRYWCNANETDLPDPGAWANGYDWTKTHYPPYAPYTRAYTYFPDADVMPTVNNLVPVGRIVTQTRFMVPPGLHKGPIASAVARTMGVNYFGEKHDPGVMNYINKLKSWEKHLPQFENTSVFTVGGDSNDTQTWDPDDISAFQVNYGGKSTVYVSPSLWNANGELQTACPTSNPYCNSTSDSGQAMAVIKNQNRTAWILTGHGGHPAIEGLDLGLNPGSPFFAYGQWGVNINGGAQLSENVITDSAINPPGGWPGIVGHVVANSCQVASFAIISATDKQIAQAIYPTQDKVASFAESLLTEANGGAVNTLLNSDVGWAFTDNEFNDGFENVIKETWQQCGTFGEAYINYISQVGTWYSYQTHNRWLGGDPLAAIAAPYYECGRNNNTATTGGSNVTQ